MSDDPVRDAAVALAEVVASQEKILAVAGNGNVAVERVLTALADYRHAQAIEILHPRKTKRRRKKPSKNHPWRPKFPTDA